MRSYGSTSTRSAERGKEVVDPAGLANLADPEDLAGLADPGNPGGAADPVGLAALAQVAPRPMKSCVTTLAIVTTRSSSASVTRPTILVSKGRI